MIIVKRNGKKEEIKFDKILQRVKNLSNDLKVEPVSVAQKVVAGLRDGITSKEVDNLLAETAAVLSVEHPDYSKLAARIAVSSLHKETVGFYQTMKNLYKEGYLSDEFISIVKENGRKIEDAIKEDRDFNFDYFGYKTLERSYLLKLNNKVVERPQYMFMRAAIGVCGDDVKRIIELYNLMSQGYYTHATPTLFNAGLKKQQMSSCYLVAMESDSVDGIYNTLKECALISKHAGGIGLHIHDVRAKNSLIKGTNGTSNGIVPMLKVFNETMRYVDQCFHPDTLVYTKSGVKKIKNILVGDEVVTQTGEFGRVSKVFRTNNMDRRRMLELDLKHSFEKVLVTEAHPMLVLKNQKRMTNYSVIENRLNEKLILPEYIPAVEITLDDFIAFSIPTYEKDIPEYSEDDMRFYGCMVGDGHLEKDETQGYICGHTEKDDFDFYAKYLAQNGCKVAEYTDNNYKTARFSPHLSFFKFGRVHLYDQNDEKIIHESFLHLPINKAKQIVKGVLETDGFIGKDDKGTEIVLEMTSKNVIDGIRYILLRMGILTSGAVVDRVGESHETKKGEITSKKIAYRLRIPKTKEICELFGYQYDLRCLTHFKWENFIFSRVDSIEKIQYQGLIYDLELDENAPHPSYLTSSGLAHNGGGKRKGSCAVYMEPWHADVQDFLNLKKNTGKEEFRTRDLFLALWVPDLFMNRVKNDEMWSLMCPNECPGLSDVYDDGKNNEFSKLYLKYEKEGKFRKQVKARELMLHILEAQAETGVPYVLYKDAANKKSNQKNIGIIKSSNLCTEIMEVSTPDETAVCNLASLCLPKYVVTDKKTKETKFDFEKLHEVTKISIKNLNSVIDRNFYPTEKTKKSNLRHRPVGLGVQGLADVFSNMKIAYDSEEAKQLNKEIFETMYHAALTASNEEAIRISSESAEGNNTRFIGAYETFEGSPASKGILQFDMWEITPSDRYDWKQLKKSIMQYGLRNSLLMAPMPTASTSQIFGNSEEMAPMNSNIYKRQTLSGEFIVVNKNLIKDLEELNLWNKEIRDKIIAENGSVQNIPEIPDNLKMIYKTVWEISQKTIIDMAADRGAYICQSQSMSLYFPKPNFGAMNSALFYAWEKGLKTGMYYCRTKAALDAEKVTIKQTMSEVSSDETKKAENIEAVVCSLENPESCEVCSS